MRFTAFMSSVGRARGVFATSCAQSFAHIWLDNRCHRALHTTRRVGARHGAMSPCMRGRGCANQACHQRHVRMRVVLSLSIQPGEYIARLRALPRRTLQQDPACAPPRHVRRVIRWLSQVAAIAYRTRLCKHRPRATRPPAISRERRFGTARGALRRMDGRRKAHLETRLMLACHLVLSSSLTRRAEQERLPSLCSAMRGRESQVIKCHHRSELDEVTQAVPLHRACIYAALHACG